MRACYILLTLLFEVARAQDDQSAKELVDKLQEIADMIGQNTPRKISEIEEGASDVAMKYQEAINTVSGIYGEANSKLRTFRGELEQKKGAGDLLRKQMRRYKRAARDRMKGLQSLTQKEYTKFGDKLGAAKNRLLVVKDGVMSASSGLDKYRAKTQSELNNIDRLFSTDAQRAEFEISREKKVTNKEFAQQVAEHEASGAAMEGMVKQMMNTMKGTNYIISKALGYVTTVEEQAKEGVEEMKKDNAEIKTNAKDELSQAKTEFSTDAQDEIGQAKDESTRKWEALNETLDDQFATIKQNAMRKARVHTRDTIRDTKEAMQTLAADVDSEVQATTNKLSPDNSQGLPDQLARVEKAHSDTGGQFSSNLEQAEATLHSTLSSLDFDANEGPPDLQADYAAVKQPITTVLQASDLSMLNAQHSQSPALIDALKTYPAEYEGGLKDFRNAPTADSIKADAMGSKGAFSFVKDLAKSLRDEWNAKKFDFSREISQLKLKEGITAEKDDERNEQTDAILRRADKWMAKKLDSAAAGLDREIGLIEDRAEKTTARGAQVEETSTSEARRAQGTIDSAEGAFKNSISQGTANVDREKERVRERGAEMKDLQSTTLGDIRLMNGKVGQLLDGVRAGGSAATKLVNDLKRSMRALVTKMQDDASYAVDEQAEKFSARSTEEEQTLTDSIRAEGVDVAKNVAGLSMKAESEQASVAQMFGDLIDDIRGKTKEARKQKKTIRKDERDAKKLLEKEGGVLEEDGGDVLPDDRFDQQLQIADTKVRDAVGDTREKTEADIAKALGVEAKLQAEGQAVQRLTTQATAGVEDQFATAKQKIAPKLTDAEVQMKAIMGEMSRFSGEEQQWASGILDDVSAVSGRAANGAASTADSDAATQAQIDRQFRDVTSSAAGDIATASHDITGEVDELKSRADGQAQQVVQHGALELEDVSEYLAKVDKAVAAQVRDINTNVDSAGANVGTVEQSQMKAEMAAKNRLNEVLDAVATQGSNFGLGDAAAQTAINVDQLAQEILKAVGDIHTATNEKIASMVTTHGGTVQQIQQEVNSDETVANTYLTAAETQVDNAVGEITENLTSANANMEDAVSGVDQAHTDLTSFSTNFMKAVMDLKKERQRKFDKVSGDSSRFMQQIIDQVFRPQLQMIENVKGGAAGATAAAESSLARTRRAFESAMQQDHFKLMKRVEDADLLASRLVSQASTRLAHLQKWETANNRWKTDVETGFKDLEQNLDGVISTAQNETQQFAGGLPGSMNVVEASEDARIEAERKRLDAIVEGASGAESADRAAAQERLKANSQSSEGDVQNLQTLLAGANQPMNGTGNSLAAFESLQAQTDAVLGSENSIMQSQMNSGAAADVSNKVDTLLGGSGTSLLQERGALLERGLSIQRARALELGQHAALRLKHTALAARMARLRAAVRKRARSFLSRSAA